MRVHCHDVREFAKRHPQKKLSAVDQLRHMTAPAPSTPGSSASPGTLVRHWASAATGTPASPPPVDREAVLPPGQPHCDPGGDKKVVNSVFTGVEVTAVSRLPSGDLDVYVARFADRERLVYRAAEWLPRLTGNPQIINSQTETSRARKRRLAPAKRLSRWRARVARSSGAQLPPPSPVITDASEPDHQNSPDDTDNRKADSSDLPELLEPATRPDSRLLPLTSLPTRNSSHIAMHLPILSL
ncbi:hypothetical protein BJX62DRAFT_238230 [Aspergillus germanicus]